MRVIHALLWTLGEDAGDLDLVVDLDPPEALKAVRCLRDLGLIPTVPVDPEDFANSDVRQAWIRDKGMTVFSMVDPNDPLRRVDLFVTEPIEFAELWNRSDILDLDGVPIRTAAIAHLIQMKIVAGRPHDMEDVDVLRRLVENEADE